MSCSAALTAGPPVAVVLCGISERGDFKYFGKTLKRDGNRSTVANKGQTQSCRMFS